MGKIEEKINNLLNLKFSPSLLNVVNESYMHNVPEGSESHFKLIIVSDNFKDMPTLKRHKIIYKELDNLMNLIHAVSIHPFDENEYKNNPMTLDSPDCVNK